MSITMNQRTFKVELFQGDDLDRLAELSSAATKAKPPGQSTALEDGEYAAAAQAHDEFLAEAKTRAVIVEMQADAPQGVPAAAGQHPPREDDPATRRSAPTRTFIEPLLKASLAAPSKHREAAAS
jgi:hypothetical protein